MTRLRIAVIQRHFSKHGSEIQQYTYALVTALARQHDIHVFAESMAEDVQDTQDDMSLTCISIWPMLPESLSQWWFAWRVAQLTRRGFDVVHSFENTWVGQIQTMYELPLAYSMFTPSASHWQRWRHWLKPHQWLTWCLENQRRKMTSQRQLIALTRPLQKVLTQTLGCPESRVSLIPVGVDLTQELSAAEREQKRLQTRLALAIPMSAKLLVWQGEAAQQGGLITVLQALAWLPEQYHLLIATPVPARIDWEMAVTPSIQNRLHVQDGYGGLDAELPYWAADVFVQPTREHTLGVSVLKAMAHGLPVVISAPKYCGVAGEFTHGQQAIVVSAPEDSQELRRAILVATDDRRADELGQRARQWAQNHNWQNIVKLHEKLYFLMVATSK